MPVLMVTRFEGQGRDSLGLAWHMHTRYRTIPYHTILIYHSYHTIYKYIYTIPYHSIPFHTIYQVYHIPYQTLNQTKPSHTIQCIQVRFEANPGVLDRLPETSIQGQQVSLSCSTAPPFGIWCSFCCFSSCSNSGGRNGNPCARAFPGENTLAAKLIYVSSPAAWDLF